MQIAGDYNCLLKAMISNIDMINNPCHYHLHDMFVATEWKPHGEENNISISQQN